MSFDLLNPWMLAGLAGIGLPIIAHLLSKKKYDIVEWGAMQFLELGRETRRKVKLEEFLLLLVRILLIALIVFALSRPWASGGIFKHLVSTQPRDVVLVVDGSFSMGWEDTVETPHQAAIDWAGEFLNDLGSGDTVAILDARDQVREVIGRPTRDLEWVREELASLPEPAGSSNLAEACTRAVQILGQTTNLERDVIVLTDSQSRPWSTGDANRWLRFDDLLEQPAVKPRIWFVDVTKEHLGSRANFTVGPIKLSRELTVTDFPVRLSTTIGYSGGTSPISKRVEFLIDGKAIPDRALTVQLQPDGQKTVEFEHRFQTVGSYVVGVRVEGDSLPGDNLSQAAITVERSLPVLLVDGDEHFDPTESETFFARAALSPEAERTPWIRAEVVNPAQWNKLDLNAYAAVILANVHDLSVEQIQQLTDFVEQGGGVMFALGNQSSSANSEALNEAGLLPLVLRKIERDTTQGNDQTTSGVRIEPESLELPWLARFRDLNESTLLEARFDSWWDVELSEIPAPTKSSETRRTAAVPAARLTNGKPLLLTAERGRGRILMMTAPLDADWSTLPAKPDFVPFLHEAIFYLASAGSNHNVSPGVPLLVSVPADFEKDKFAFFDPEGDPHPVTMAGTPERPLAQFSETTLPGVYTFERLPRDSSTVDREYFVVEFDRRESDLTPLDETEIAFLTDDGRMSLIATHQEIREALLTDTSRAELWPWLLFLFLGFLVFEVWMTRRLVQGGHVSDEIFDRQQREANKPVAQEIEIEEFEDYFERAPVKSGRTVRDSREL